MTEINPVDRVCASVSIPIKLLKKARKYHISRSGSLIEILEIKIREYEKQHPEECADE